MNVRHATQLATQLAGDVTLKNLELRPDALTALNLPVVVTRGKVPALSCVAFADLSPIGVVGQLWLFVPWSNLKTQRIRLVLEDVFALVEPNSKLSYSPEREAQTMAKATSPSFGSPPFILH